MCVHCALVVWRGPLSSPSMSMPVSIWPFLSSSAHPRVVPLSFKGIHLSCCGFLRPRGEHSICWFRGYTSNLSLLNANVNIQ